MKTFNTLFIAFVGLLFTLAVDSVAQGQGRGNNSQMISSINNMPVEELTAEETASLLIMREEEKLARDVYLELFDTWNLRIFSNIARSEQQHTNMIAVLLQKYELSDPMVDDRGVFENEDLAGLYKALTEKGKESLAAGLSVGATIEDLDIYDLQEALEYTDNQDIRFVYQNLLKGSRNHMRSFYGQISAQKSTYTAQYITAEELHAIINSDMERGAVDENGAPISTGQKGKGKGKGRGQCDNSLQNKKNESRIKMSNYPNPANPSTTIQYSLEQPADVSLSIYNVTGQVVRQVNMGYNAAGEYAYKWDAANEFGAVVPSGVYFYQIQADDLVATQRLFLIR